MGGQMKFGLTLVVTIALLLSSTAAFGARRVPSITSDDNASNCPIKKFYKDVSTPLVFCGVNYKADAYGFPRSNVTGLVGVPPVIDLMAPVSFPGATRKADEPGDYAAATALKILNGSNVGEIPVVRKTEADIMINSTFEFHVGAAFSRDKKALKRRFRG
jgi:hypothetical protein